MSSSHPYGAPTSGNTSKHSQESTKQPKSPPQEQHHGRKSELFQQLRDSITGLTNQDPGSTRYEILTGSANLLTTLHSERTQMKQQLVGNPPTQDNGTNRSDCSYGFKVSDRYNSWKYGLVMLTLIV
ncbi:hypothetical protein V8B97DRAFT_1916873 [Scleroderma yunnanense]